MDAGKVFLLQLDWPAQGTHSNLSLKQFANAYPACQQLFMRRPCNGAIHERIKWVKGKGIELLHSDHFASNLRV